MIFNIRRMKDTDIDAVYLIETSVHIAPWSKDILRDCVLVGYDCRVLEVLSDGNLVIAGYIITRQAENTAHILNFCIAKPLQSKGYGRRLLQTLLYSKSKYPEVESVILEVRPSNTTALHLYESMGFKQVEIKKDYYKDNSKTEDAILLKKTMHN